MDRLVELARGKRIVALTGAGCSTESGIPDYRGPDPEVSSNAQTSLGGVDQGLIPPLSRLTATLKLTF